MFKLVRAGGSEKAAPRGDIFDLKRMREGVMGIHGG